MLKKLKNDFHNEAMNSSLPKYYVRFSEEKDKEKIFKYYIENKHDCLTTRREALLSELISGGSVVIIESEKGDIIASSITYPCMEDDQLKWQEVGTTRITLNGYKGIFDLLITAQLLRAYSLNPPSEFFIAQMETRPVQMIAENIGWKKFGQDRDDIAKASTKTLDTSHDPNYCKSSQDWFYIDEYSIVQIAETLSAISKDPVLKHYKNPDKSIEVSFERSPLLLSIIQHMDKATHSYKKQLPARNDNSAAKTLKLRKKQWINTLR